jgi:putative FmdB family regulatory protein
VSLPLYEYQCTACGKRIEKIQKFADEPLTECAECGGKLERLLSSSAIQFKGSGWYVTDYARKSESPSRAAERSSDGGDKKASETTKKPKTPATKSSKD